MLDSWKNSEDNDVKNGLVDWMFENDTSTLMEEGEDILDGLEMMAKAGEVSDKLLIDCTDLITTLIVARNLDDEEMMPAFQKDGKSTLRNKKLTRQSRAENMMKIRKELLEKKNQRKQWDLRTWAQESYQDLEIKRVKRREAARRMEGVKAEDVDNKFVQDRSTRIQVVGSDVAALYPSLEAIEVARIVYNAVMESEVIFKGVNYTEAARMIALTSSEQECRLGPLRRVLPRRRSNQGTRPGITGEDPLSGDTGSQDQWKFPPLGKNGLTTLEKRMLIAQVMQKSVLAIFQTHTYSFGRKFFLQKRGGPIGLRSTCCVARLVMMWWDKEFLEVAKKSNLTIKGGARYMDDVRVWLAAVRLGWRWMSGRLMYKEEWMMEERGLGMTPLTKTTEIIEGMMNSICSWLVLTMETEEMFEDKKLPTLDIKIWVEVEDNVNVIKFEFFEKEMVSPMVLHRRSAMPEGIRRATLNQELIRRMVNTSVNTW